MLQRLRAVCAASASLLYASCRITHHVSIGGGVSMQHCLGDHGERTECKPIKGLEPAGSINRAPGGEAFLSIFTQKRERDQKLKDLG